MPPSIVAHYGKSAPVPGLLADAGTRLPVDKVRHGLTRLVAEGLASTAEGLEAFATAILTTDTRPKVATATVALPAEDLLLRQVRVTGVAKGVGATPTYTWNVA